MRDGVGGPVYAEFESLAVVAEVGGAGECRSVTLRCECGAGFGFEIAKDLRDLRSAGGEHHCARKFTAQVGVEDPECGESAGSGGNENAANAEDFCE